MAGNKYAKIKIKKVRQYAKDTLDKEACAKVEKSYKNGMILIFAYVIALFAFMMLYIFISVGFTAGKVSLGTMKDEGTARVRLAGSYVDVDVSDYIKDGQKGDKYMLYFDKQSNVINAVEYGKYQTEHQSKVMADFMILMVIIMGSFAGFYVLYKKVVAKDWTEFVKVYDKQVLKK